MNGVYDSLAEPIERLGWTLIHFLWQGTLVAACFGLGRSLTPRSGPFVRYGMACVALAGMVLCCLATWFVLGVRQGLASAPVLQPDPFAGFSFGDALSLANWSGPSVAGSHGGWEFGRELENCLPWIVGTWFLGVALLSLRVAAGWVRVEQMRRRWIEPIDGALLEAMSRLEEGMGVRRPVLLVKSWSVAVPTVIGWLKPVILLPAACVARLSPEQLEFCLAHELAHIRRHDYWVNWAQICVETLLFYHPAVWWVSRCVREEREACCDDLAIRVCGNRLAYAEVLATLEEMRVPKATFALAATDGALLQRIRRILALDNPVLPAWPRIASRSLWLAGGLLLVAGVALHLGTPALYRAIARVALEAPGVVDGAPGMTAGIQLDRTDPYFIQTEFEKMRSQHILTRVAKEIGLQPDRSTVAKLRHRIELRQSPRTAVIEICASDEDSGRSAGIANALANVYIEAIRDRNAWGLSQLERQLQSQQEKVNLVQQELADLATRLGLRLGDGGPEGDELSSDSDKIRPLLTERSAAETQAAVLSAKLDALRGLDRTELRETLPTVSPDEPLAQLLHAAQTNEQQLALRTYEYTSNHPETDKLRNLAKTIEVQIDRRVDGIVRGLEMQANMQRKIAHELTLRIESASRENKERADQLRPYVRLRDKLRSEEGMLGALRLKADAERTQSALEPGRQPEIVDHAEPPLHPRRMLGKGAASLLGSGLALCLAGLLVRVVAREPRARDTQV